MRALVLRFQRLAGRFKRNERGVAAVEFALILPFLLLLYIGSIEASSFITIDRRVNIISSTIGDLVARTDGTLTNSQLTDFFKASQGIIFPYSTTPLKQVVSLVSVAANGDTLVRWSCGYNGGVAKTLNLPYVLPPKMNELARTSGWIVASEASYPYSSNVGIVFTEAINLSNSSFYLPRYEREIGAPADC